MPMLNRNRYKPTGKATNLLKIVIRADASVQIGAGHIYRCLTLALSCRNRGAEVHFICLETDGDHIGFIESLGFTVHRMSYATFFHEETDIAVTGSLLREIGEPIDWLVVDHYGAGEYWERSLRMSCKKIFVLDDLARTHDCDMLLDQNYFRDPKQRYEGKVPESAELLLGPRYA
jgi:UDP-2,4-diacetamido-2,4,6-trideoxy-beta-L-altropyranose hydrolase